MHGEVTNTTMHGKLLGQQNIKGSLKVSDLQSETLFQAGCDGGSLQLGLVQIFQ